MKRNCPCDSEPFVCPYDAEYNRDCEFHCGEEEPEEESYEEYMDLDMGFDPYMGCYTDDC